MNTNQIRKLYWFGVIAPVWLVIGVVIASFLYPGYDHYNQALSELGATGSPTQFISPAINNYPLGVLFAVFGFSVYRTFSNSKVAAFTGILIVIHGLMSISAGYFSCDLGCKLENPSLSQELHNLSGFIMFATLFLAGIIWVVISKGILNSRKFGSFSFVCTVISLAALVLMDSAVKSGEGFGLFQRINYGASLVWMVGFACVLLVRSEVAQLR